MKKILLTVVLGISSLTGFSQSQSVLLEKYRTMAVEYNHDLKVAEKNIAISQELENMARADMKPKLSAGSNFQYTGNPLELAIDNSALGAPISFQGSNAQYGASVALLQPIYAGGKISESVKMAQHEQTFAKSGADAVRSAVYFQTDIQYWNTVARAEIVNIADDFFTSIASLVETIKDRVDVGLVDPQELLMAEVKLNEAKYQQLQAQSNFETSRMALNSIIGVDIQATTPIDSTIPIVLIQDDVIDENGDNRPEIMMAQDKIKMAQSSLKLNDSKYKPQLYVGAEGNYSSPGYNFKPDINPNYALYAKLSIPIFEWGKRKSDKRASNMRIGVAHDNLNRVTDNVNLEVQTARVALEQAIRRVDLSLSSLTKAQENERKAIERYTEGKISILEVLDAQTYRQTSQLNCVQAKVAAQGHYSELMKALNGYK